MLDASWGVDFVWFSLMLPDSVLQPLVFTKLVCFPLLLWQQVVILGRLWRDFVTENCTILPWQQPAWLAVLCLVCVLLFFFKYTPWSQRPAVATCCVTALLQVFWWLLSQEPWRGLWTWLSKWLLKCKKYSLGVGFLQTAPAATVPARVSARRLPRWVSAIEPLLDWVSLRRVNCSSHHCTAASYVHGLQC